MASDKATETQIKEAKELGLKVNSNVGSETLQRQIDEANGVPSTQVKEVKGLGKDKDGRVVLAKGNGYKVVLNKKK